MTRLILKFTLHTPFAASDVYIKEEPSRTQNTLSFVDIYITFRALFTSILTRLILEIALRAIFAIVVAN